MYIQRYKCITTNNYELHEMKLLSYSFEIIDKVIQGQDQGRKERPNILEDKIACDRRRILAQTAAPSVRCFQCINYKYSYLLSLLTCLLTK